MVRSLDELTPDETRRAGGKGSTLARLRRSGYPVPDGLVILPEAFEADGLKPEAWELAQPKLTRLSAQNGRSSFAVRSSALSEDSARASFAGEFETLLDVRGHDVRTAIETVRRSRHADRARAYGAAHGLNGVQEMAVVVQRFVRADFSGVLFTADPLTGSRSRMMGNYVPGAGDRLVAGEADPIEFTLERPGGRYHGPAELRPVARELFDVADRLERDQGGPQDIEWAASGARIALVQSRPITTLQAHNPATGEWNDSLAGDYLWSNGNFGEALPGVMTPLTWSMMQVFFRVNALGIESALPMGGNLAGRLYINLTLLFSLFDSLHVPRRWTLRAVAETFGRLPDGIRTPTMPLSGAWVLRTLLPQAWRRLREVVALKRRVPGFIAGAPGEALRLEASIAAASASRELLAVWQAELRERLDETMRMLAAGTSDYKRLSREVHLELERLVGESDANALMSGITGEAAGLASLGPVIGLSRLARGAMTREDYVAQFGHRGPEEFELSRPRLADDPDWIDRRLAEIERQPVDVSTLLAEQRGRRQAAWARFAARYRRRAPAMRRKLDRMAEASHVREAARSEVVRMLGAVRVYALRAAELAGLGEDVFYLSLAELEALLAGDRSAVEHVATRRETHRRQAALPPYPAFIAGRFDPVRWAADPRRRTDVFDAQAEDTPALAGGDTLIRGFAGASGVVEGRVRVLTSLDEADSLQAGEVLVTVTTNIGWTPLFPRAAAIVTDIGAPLSHAAIVARELGVPAVVGARDATMRLKTGDRVRVDGGRGTVEIVDGGDEAAERAPAGSA